MPRLSVALATPALLALACAATFSSALGAQPKHRATAAKARSAKKKTSAAKTSAAKKTKTATAKTAAAKPAPVAARTDSIYTGVQVDTLAEPNPATFVPRYPPGLRARQVGGTVVVQFVVDTTGQVDMGSFKVLSSSDTAFTTSVRAAVARTDFYPALLDGRKVRQLYEQPFTFAVDSVARAGSARAAGARPAGARPR